MGNTKIRVGKVGFVVVTINWAGILTYPGPKV